MAVDGAANDTLVDGGSEAGLGAEIRASRHEVEEHRSEVHVAREDLIRHMSVQFHLLRADLRTLAERISALSARIDHLLR
jgi:hypothetical protein